MSGRRAWERLYAGLLVLYPKGFRARYGAELRETFRRRLEGERGRSGALGAIGFAARACADVPVSAVRVQARGGFGNDFRYARRSLGRNPAFSLTAIGVLAMGVAAGVSVFSVLNAVVLTPLPYAQPDRLVTIWALNVAQQLPDGVSWPTVQDWRQRNRTLTDVAAYYRPQFTQRTLTGDGRPVRVQSGAVSPNFFELLGVKPVIGRTFGVEENRDDARVALISHQLWQQKYAGSDDVLGKTMVLDGERVAIIGVMPPNVRLPTADTEIWEPLFRHLRGDEPTVRTWDALVALGRLEDGTTFERAREDLTTVADNLMREYPEELEGLGALMRPLTAEVMGSALPRALWLLFGAVLCVLLVACTNVANLALARGLDRSHEFAVRTALGAGRGQLVRQLMVENMVMALAGATLGLALSTVGTRLLVALAPADTPRLDEVGLNAEIILSVGLVSLLLGPLFGLPAALWAAVRAPQAALKSGTRSSPSRGQRRLRRAMVVGEVAMAIVLMSGALLLGRSLSNVWQVDAGFEPSRTLVMRVDLLDSRYAETPQVEQFYRSALEAVRAVPGVLSAGAITDVFRTRIPDASITAEGREPPASDALQPPLISDWVVPGYFEAMGIELVRGRFFEDHELGVDARTDAGAIIINETMARTFWPDGDALGKRLQWGRPNPDRPWLTVVGIVADTRGGPLDEAPISNAFTPFVSRRMHLVVRTHGDPTGLGPSIEAAVRTLDPDVPLSNMMTAADWYADSIAQRRFQTLVLILFAAAAIVLAATGIYGLMHDSVAHRRREIGIRIAVGASTGNLLRMVLREGLLLAAAGMSIGLAIAVAVSDVMASFLYGVSATDPLILAGASLALLGIAGLATAVPARRAARMDPVASLRG